MIQDLQQLRGIDRDLGGSYVLGNRIAGGHSSFLSIGNASAFGGTFDGLGNTIDNLAVYGTGAYSGLFSVNRGTLRNLNLERIPPMEHRPPTTTSRSVAWPPSTSVASTM